MGMMQEPGRKEYGTLDIVLKIPIDANDGFHAAGHRWVDNITGKPGCPAPLARALVLKEQARWSEGQIKAWATGTSLEKEPAPSDSVPNIAPAPVEPVGLAQPEPVKADPEKSDKGKDK